MQQETDETQINKTREEQQNVNTTLTTERLDNRSQKQNQMN